MSDPGLTTPVQPVRRGGAPGTLAVGVTILAVVGLLAWHPWTAPGPGQADLVSPLPLRVVPAGPVGPEASADPDLFGGPTTGPWSGRVTGEWSIVAFLRPDPLSREPLNLRQQQVAVFVGPKDLGARPEAICDQDGTFLHRAAADLPAGGVRFLGIAFPSDRRVYVDRVARIGGELRALPVELGRVPGVGADLTPQPAASASAAASAAPRTTGPGSPAPDGPGAPEPVRTFALAGGGPWPDGVYRFEVFTADGLPVELFACIRP